MPAHIDEFISRVAGMESGNMQVRALLETDRSEYYGRKSSNLGTDRMEEHMHTLWYD